MHPVQGNESDDLADYSARQPGRPEVADDSAVSAVWSGRAILHVDLDAFFAAVEQLDHLEWRGRPVIVGGAPEKRGVVSTASYEARTFGIHSAMPSVRARQLCPQAIWAPPRFDRYREIAEQVRAIFADESPLVQPVSIDEAYLDVTPGRFTAEDPVEIANRIRTRIAAIGITASVGVATSKSVAKIASDADKPDGLTVVRPGTEAAFLAPLPVGAIPGIGPRSVERLVGHGIRRLGDLARLDDATATALLGNHGPELVRRARGIDARPVHPNAPAKSVSNERTFAEDVRAAAEVDEALDALVRRVGRRLRASGIAGRTVTVKLRYSDFTTRTIQRTLDQATGDEEIFGPIAHELVREAWHEGVGLRLLGVGLSGFEEHAEQLDLFGAGAGATSTTSADEAALAPPLKRSRVLKGVDAVRARFGEQALRVGAREAQAARPHPNDEAQSPPPEPPQPPSDAEERS